MNRRRLLKAAAASTAFAAAAPPMVWARSSRTLLCADLTLNSGDFASLQAAADEAVYGYDTQGFNLKIAMADGEHSGACVKAPLVGGGFLSFVGNSTNINAAAACIVHGGFQALYGAMVQVIGCKLDTPMDGQHLLMARYRGSLLQYGWVQLGAAITQIYADEFGQTRQIGDTGILASGTFLICASHIGNCRVSSGALIPLADLDYRDPSGVNPTPLLYCDSQSDITIETSSAFAPGATYTANGHTVLGIKAQMDGSTLQWSNHYQSDLLGNLPAIFSRGGTWIGN